MAKEQIFKFRMRKEAVGCILGRPAHEPAVGEERDELQCHWVPEAAGCENLHLTPGDEFVDVTGHLQMKREHGEDHFVRCEDRKLAQHVLKVPTARLVIGKADGEYAGKVLGFYGWQYVLEDISSEFRKTNKIGSNQAQNVKALAEMDTQLSLERGKRTEAEQQNTQLRAQLSQVSVKAGGGQAAMDAKHHAPAKGHREG